MVPTFCPTTESPENISVVAMCNKFRWLLEHAFGSVGILFCLPAVFCLPPLIFIVVKKKKRQNKVYF